MKDASMSHHHDDRTHCPRCRAVEIDRERERCGSCQREVEAIKSFRKSLMARCWDLPLSKVPLLAQLYYLLDGYIVDRPESWETSPEWAQRFVLAEFPELRDEFMQTGIV